MYMSKSLIVAIQTNDQNAINSIKRDHIVNRGWSLVGWLALYHNTIDYIINTKPYKFVDFSPQVISRNDDKSSVSKVSKAPHNED